MTNYKIGVIPGDGIGEEVVPEGISVLKSVSEMTNSFKLDFEYFPWGCNYYLKHGKMMADDGLTILRNFDAIYFGAVGFPSVPDYISLRGLRLPICQGFDEYVCYRPSKILPGIKSPLAGRKEGDIDFVVIRENTEGEYSGAGGRVHHGLPSEIAVETSVFSRQAVERVIDYSFQLARKRRGHLISASKSNAQQHSLRMWDEIFDSVSRSYPDVKTERVLIDALAARFVLKPDTLDVVVASNLFGDILTDLGAAVCGSMGIAPSGNLNPEKTYPSMFEPVHGSAPDIYGKGIANPIGMILSGAMMLEFLGQKESANIIYKAVDKCTIDGSVLTPDLGGAAATHEVTKSILNFTRVSS